jgi:hypothetical protein
LRSPRRNLDWLSGWFFHRKAHAHGDWSDLRGLSLLFNATPPTNPKRRVEGNGKLSGATAGALGLPGIPGYGDQASFTLAFAGTLVA